MTKAIQVCGTGSGVGKSVIVTALCRLFLQDGFRVCPFKAQNMSLNSFVTKDREEMGRAQVTQAQACCLEPRADMNPILIKPTGDTASQIIVQGRPIGNMTAREYQNKKTKAGLFKKVKESFNRLKKEYELIIIEGAGSPVEINLKKHDIVNMRMASFANAPVILAGDIDKGGVFASLVGTLELLEEKERKLIRGFIINKFRGDRRLLRDGLDFLEEKTGIPVIGVIPYFKDIRIPEEDSVVLENRVKSLESRGKTKEKIKIAVIKLPHISNFTDFDALENEADVNLSYINNKDELESPDVIILPGTKNTIKDLLWLKESGIAKQILRTMDYGLWTVLIGICGGYQMLGEKIYDAKKIESDNREVDGLGVLPLITNFKKAKALSQVKAEEIDSGHRVSGYEIHHGRTKCLKKLQPLFKIIEREGKCIDEPDGIASADRRIMATYIHGVFDKPGYRRSFLNRIRIRKGLAPSSEGLRFNLDKEFDKLADLVRRNIDIKLLYKILNCK